jgi:hypothetical protein
MIRYITCLGCDKSFEVKPFIKHCRDCRLSNQVPFIDGFKYWNNKDQLNESDQKESESEVERNTQSTNYKVLVKQSSSSQQREKVSSPSMFSSKIYNTRSNPILSPAGPRRKLNRERINSQVYGDPKEDIDINEFIEPTLKESVSNSNELESDK